MIGQLLTPLSYLYFQEYLFGKNVYDYIHESDHKELAKQFTEDKRADNSSKSLSVDNGYRGRQQLITCCLIIVITKTLQINNQVWKLKFIL